jgi:hypothetical protein
MVFMAVVRGQWFVGSGAERAERVTVSLLGLARK